MLANNLAEVVTDCSSVIVSVGRPGRKFPRLRRGCRRLRQGADLLDGVDADSVGFPQGAVDSASLGNAHFGTVDEECNIGGIGIDVTNEGLALWRRIRRINGRFKVVTRS